MTSIGYADAVNEALERLDDLGFERGAQGDLANHGPMGAEALAVLGHGDQVAAWVEGYRNAVPHHAPPVPGFALDVADESSWRPALGDFGRVGDWEQLFRRELAEAPWREVLIRWWPRLLPGLLAGLTHGVIRTAHAVRGLAATAEPSPLQITEFARGLAYWAARFAHLPGQVRLHGKLDIAAAIDALPRKPLEQSTIDGPPRPGVTVAQLRTAAVARRLRHLDEMPGYFEALESVAPDDPQWLLSEMTIQFADVYVGHPEVFPVPLIHGVTAPAAVRLVLPHLPTVLHEPSVAALWQVHTALLLGFTGDRGGEGAFMPEADLPSFDELTVIAVEHGDEHVIKFTEACLREHALRPDPRYPAAVAAAHKRIARR